MLQQGCQMYRKTRMHVCVLLHNNLEPAEQPSLREKYTTSIRNTAEYYFALSFLQHTLIIRLDNPVGAIGVILSDYRAVARTPHHSHNCKGTCIYLAQNRVFHIQMRQFCVGYEELPIIKIRSKWACNQSPLSIGMKTRIRMRLNTKPLLSN